MSVNITVNGKYIKSYQQRHHLLDDPDRVRKENENERRKLRLQQVRNASKIIAKEVRTNVELEKEKQLKKFEEIKALELDEWRRNVLAQKEKDFRSAIFQVGHAHRAAQAENISVASQKKKKIRSIKKSVRLPKPVTSSSRSENKENVLKNANVQTNITGNCYQGRTRKSGNRYANFSNMSKSDVQQISSEWDEYSLDSSSDSSMSSSSLTNYDTVSKDNKVKETNFESGPLPSEVEQTKNDAIEIGSPHLVDKSHKQSSQQLNKEAPQKQTSENLGLKTIDDKKKPQSTSSAKRFTQISDIILQQKTSALTNPQTVPVAKQQPVGITHLDFTSKSPGSYLPVSTQTEKALTSKTSSNRSTSTKVQFFDYNNKFHKNYDQPSDVIESHDSMPDKEINAMQTAAFEVQRQQSREAEMNKLRQISSERCQKAVEKEQVRRSCEELTAKLDALTKQRQILHSDNYQYASHRIQQAAKVKETKLNTAVEDILKRPAIITCPVIDHADSNNLPSAPDVQKQFPMRGLNVNPAFNNQNSVNSFNSSDSCCSILLGHVDDQSKQIAEDILKLKSQNRKADNATARKLQNLLTRINQVRENLMRELEKCLKDQALDKDRVQNIMDSISDLRKEREHILTDNTPIDSIEERENDLKKKEAVLEKKIREFYEIHKLAKQQKKLSTDQINEIQKPKEIKERKKEMNKRNIQTNPDKSLALEETKFRNKKESQQKDKNNKNVDKESSSSEEEKIPDKFTDHRRILVNEKPVEIIIRVKGDNSTKKLKKLPPKSPRKLSSLIQTPVHKKYRQKSSVRSFDSTSTSYRSLPNKIHNNVDNIIKNIPHRKPDIIENRTDVQSEEESAKVKKKKSTLNPLMAHYVQRLLSMSRTSINALGVSSSEVETPSTSIIDTTSNLSAAETEKLAALGLENAQKILSDNYSFVGELEESLRQSKSNDSSLKTVEIAWKKALKEDQNKKKNLTEVKKPLKPSLKNATKKQHSQFEEDKQRPISFADKSTQMTDNCNQRIAELTQMINKVRKEKQKILETTLSSASENGRNSTEYLDLPDRRNNSDESSSRILDSQVTKSISNNLPAHMLEPVEATPFAGLEKDKFTGISRDSGISLSRPITVQELRESSSSEIRKVQSSTESLSGNLKNPKPPISISRYSPQLPEEIPHELSTIFEVDTPATSRLNTSVRPPLGHDTAVQVAPSVHDFAVQVKDKVTEQIAYRKFPSFEQYARINNLDLTQFDPEFSLRFEKEFNDFMNLAKEGRHADYEQFTSFSKCIAKPSANDNQEAAEELLASLKLANLSFKKFATRTEYLNKIGVNNSDLIDSQSLENIENSKNSNNSSSSSSMINIENELKLRNIISKPFQQQSLTNADRDVNSIGSSSVNLQNKKQSDISGIIQLSSGTVSMDEQSNNLEDDLKKIGINWPSGMKKKTIETQALSSSSLSNAEVWTLMPKRKTHNATKLANTSAAKKAQTSQDMTVQSEDGGQQLNLREFLKKELLKRTATSSSLSFSDDSVASSILRSILGSITPSDQHQQHPNDVNIPTLERHKTSTPMASQSTSSSKLDSKSQGGVTSSIQLFSGESRLSSVHFINNSNDVNNTTTKNV